MDNMNNTDQYNPDNLSPTQLWGLAISTLLSEMNFCRHDILHHHGTSETDIEELRHVLKRDWGIESREELLDMLDWLEKDGHNTGYMAMQHHLNSLSEASMNAYITNFDHNKDHQSKLMLVKNYRHTLNEGGIGAWDYGRYVSLCRWGASLNYISEEECWAFIFKIAPLVQQSYEDWYSFGVSYMAGRMYWRAIATEDRAISEMDIIRRLTGNASSPWNVLDWNEPLAI